jgi:hypothetical protein
MNDAGVEDASALAWSFVADGRCAMTFIEEIAATNGSKIRNRSPVSTFIETQMK